MTNNKIFLHNIGNLVEAQHASYFNFLYFGISKELKNFPNPVFTKIRFPTRNTKSKNDALIYFSTGNLKYQGPNNTIEDCLKRNITYSLACYLPSQYCYDYDKKKDRAIIHLNRNLKKVLIKQDVYLAEIPLITDQGSFIINGYEKVIISQIIRSPGIYFQKSFNNSKKIIYNATIISDKGIWTHVYLDDKEGKDKIYFSLNEYQKKDTDKAGIENMNNISLLDLIHIFGVSFEEISDFLKYPLFLEKLEDKNSLVLKKKKEKIEIINKLKQRAFNSNNGFLSIGEVGRYKLNKKFGFNLKLSHLTIFDLIEIINGLIELKYFEYPSDDIDHLKNKKIRPIGELLQNQIKIGLNKLKKQIFKTITDKSESLTFIDIDKQNTRQSVIIDSRFVSNTLKEFFITSQLSQFMDQINPLAELTHKRRISVFGPNGLKRDHVSLVVRDIHPSQYAKLCPIETPEGHNAGLISSLAMYSRISPLGFLETPYFFLKNQYLYNTKRAIYLNSEQESNISVAFADNLITKNGSLTTSLVSVKKDVILYQAKPKDINLYTTSPIQLISLATSLIPFMEHNDANRALMGSNMQRQAVPLMYTQKSIVSTGFESSVVQNSQTVIKNYNEGSVLYTSSDYIAIKDNLNQTVFYYLKKYKRSNQKTSLNQKVIVWPGEKVFSGQILADGSSTNDAELSLGKNLTIAYMPWEGYNFEDAIVISDKLLTEDSLTSIHIEEYETRLIHSSSHKDKLTKELLSSSEISINNLDSHGIIKIGTLVKEGDILVGKIVTTDDTELTKLIKALYKTEKSLLKDESLRVNKKGDGKVIAIKIFLEGKYDASKIKLRINIYVAQKRKVQVGDKLSGRHGNKGIISRILPSQDMPYLPDGTVVDVIFNPLGVPSRMNVGQIFECLLGLAGEYLDTRFYVSPFDEIYGKNASRMLINQKLKQAAYTKGFSWLYNPSFVGKILIRDGRTGDFFDNPVTVGKSYILKLIHLVEDKVHARSIGPYTKITEQPLAGKSKHGGQRFGEMEVWALEAYGASTTLQEILTIKSDDIDGRNDMYESILLQKNWESRKIVSPSIPDAFLVLIRELNALGLDFSFLKIKTKEQISFSKDIFLDIEKKLKLRNLLKHEKVYNLNKVKKTTHYEKDFYKNLFHLDNQNIYKGIIKEHLF